MAGDQPRYPLPPFTAATAAEKVQKAEDAWNAKDPAKVAAAYSVGEAMFWGIPLRSHAMLLQHSVN
jgi:nuclear transport factor 2 (NTF2) superfamily protein